MDKLDAIVICLLLLVNTKVKRTILAVHVEFNTQAGARLCLSTMVLAAISWMARFSLLVAILRNENHPGNTFTKYLSYD